MAFPDMFEDGHAISLDNALSAITTRLRSCGVNFLVPFVMCLYPPIYFDISIIS
jgi:hypothetical protein